MLDLFVYLFQTDWTEKMCVSACAFSETFNRHIYCLEAYLSYNKSFDFFFFPVYFFFLLFLFLWFFVFNYSQSWWRHVAQRHCCCEERKQQWPSVKSLLSLLRAIQYLMWMPKIWCFIFLAGECGSENTFNVGVTLVRSLLSSASSWVFFFFSFLLSS